jgi:hypothetical protein
MSTNTRLRSNAGKRGYFLGSSEARIILNDDEPGLLQLWRDIRAEVKREDLPLGVATKDSNRRWYEALTGRVPIGWQVVAVCYATAAILLGCWPWNLLLLLLLFPIRNKRLRFYAFQTTRSNGPMQPRASCTDGGSL